MADTLTSLADLVLINDNNLADLDISDLLDDAPLFAALNAITASNGTDHKYLKETGAPVVGFRAPNAGRDHSDSTDTLVTINLKVLDASNHVDQAIANAYAKGGPDAFIERMMRRDLKAAFYAAENQFINGTGADAGGFSGLADALGSLGAKVISAGGSANRTSVYVIRTGDDDLSAVIGNDGNIEAGERFEFFAEDGTAKKFPAYGWSVLGWLGLQLGSTHSAARLANVGTGGTLTDDLIYSVIKTFPAARQPNIICMNRTALEQLRASRTATNVTGAPAPRPTEVEGIPIVVTDAIGDAEAAVI